MDETVLSRLQKIFPQKSGADLEVFADTFRPGRWGPDKNRAARDAELQELDQFINTLTDAAQRHDWAEFQGACQSLPPDALRYLDQDDGSDMERIVARMKEYRTLSATWYKLHGRKGGRDENALLMAKEIAYIFDEIGEKVTFGTMPGHLIPSTPFCKVVEVAMSYHGWPEGRAGWKSPAKKAWEIRKLGRDD